MRLPRFKQWQVVLLSWVDSNGCEEGWHESTDEEAQVAGCVTAGQVEAQWGDRIKLVLSRDDTNKHVCGAITIPTCAVTAWKVLK